MKTLKTRLAIFFGHISLRLFGVTAKQIGASLKVVLFADKSCESGLPCISAAYYDSSYSIDEPFAFNEYPISRVGICAALIEARNNARKCKFACHEVVMQLAMA